MNIKRRTASFRSFLSAFVVAVVVVLFAFVFVFSFGLRSFFPTVCLFTETDAKLVSSAVETEEENNGTVLLSGDSDFVWEAV